MKRMILVLTIVAGLLAVAQKPPEPPKVSDTLAKNFFKAKNKFIMVQQQYTTAQQELQKAIQEMVAACGAKYSLSQSPDGDLICVAKPETPKPDEAPKK